MAVTPQAVIRQRETHTKDGLDVRRVSAEPCEMEETDGASFHPEELSAAHSRAARSG